MNRMELSVIICTYNPDLKNLQKVLEGLKQQTLSSELWEIIIVDNKSNNQFTNGINITWHPNAVVIREENPGLSFARITGVNHSKAGLIVFVDDDNVLDGKYLEKCLAFHYSHPEVGCFGGKSLPVFETPPPKWFSHAGVNLGCQDYGDELYISNYRQSDFRINHYPEKAPIGTGMVIRKDAFLKYIADSMNNSQRLELGRRGNMLTSGEDNDIILTIIKEGYEIAYLPELIVHHQIPSKRISHSYLQKMAFECNRSWVKVLHLHHICPWEPISPVTVPLRKLKYWLAMKPWKNELSRISYNERCGRIKGLSEISELSS